MATVSSSLGEGIRNTENIATRRGLATELMCGLQNSATPKIACKYLDVYVLFWGKDPFTYIKSDSMNQKKLRT